MPDLARVHPAQAQLAGRAQVEEAYHTICMV